MSDPTYLTARLAMLLYAGALAGLLVAPGRIPRLRSARLLYTAGCAVLVIHIAVAFHRHHQWSHAAAHAHVEHRTAELTGVASGAGLWLNYLFAALWLIDVSFWWVVGDARYVSRSRWIALSLHGFLLFIAINASVVFAAGASRAIGAGVVTLLALLCGGRALLRARVGHSEIKREALRAEEGDARP